MDENLFYLLGGALVLAALAVSAVGVRWTGSFPTRQAMTALLIAFGALVVGTGTFAVLGARAEQEHRESEQAGEEAQATEAVEGEAEGGAAPAAQQPQQGEPQGAAAPGESFDLTSPADGSLSFEPPDLQAGAGEITLAYDNPSPVTHNIFLQDEEETVLAESEDVTEGKVEITAKLVPGEYIYYCNIPGHREGGMEGVLTVE